MKILVVDDDKWYAESLASSLQSNKIETKLAFDAEEAMNAVDSMIPDAILLDFSLGTKNALTLLNELQSYTDTRDIPVVILSDDDMKEALSDVSRYGVCEILHKATVTPREILQCLKV